MNGTAKLDSHQVLGYLGVYVDDLLVNQMEYSVEVLMKFEPSSLAYSSRQGQLQATRKALLPGLPRDQLHLKNMQNIWKPYMHCS